MIEKKIRDRLLSFRLKKRNYCSKRRIFGEKSFYTNVISFFSKNKINEKKTSCFQNLARREEFPEWLEDCEDCLMNIYVTLFEKLR